VPLVPRFAGGRPLPWAGIPPLGKPEPPLRGGPPRDGAPGRAPPGPPTPPPGRAPGLVGTPRPRVGAPAGPTDCRGIIAGFGRGAPGTLGRGARGSPGRSVPPTPGGRVAGAWSGAGRRDRCMPCVDENGLLPGRGPLGLGVAGRGTVDAGETGVPPSAAGASGGADAADAAAEAAGAAAAGAAAGVTTVVVGAETLGTLSIGDSALAAAGTELGASAGAGAAPSAEPFAWAAFFAAALAARAALACEAAFHSSPLTSSRRRTTGASTVDEADLTNSPISLSASSTFLLGTPNSLASSWTLAFPATVLLLGRSDPRRVRTVRWWACSSHESHRDVMSRCSAFVRCLVAQPRVRPAGAARATTGPARCRAVRRAGRPSGTPAAGRRARGRWAWGAGTRPSPASWRARQVRRTVAVRRHRRPHVAGRTSPPSPDIPHTYERE